MRIKLTAAVMAAHRSARGVMRKKLRAPASNLWRRRPHMARRRSKWRQQQRGERHSGAQHASVEEACYDNGALCVQCYIQHATQQKVRAARVMSARGDREAAGSVRQAVRLCAAYHMARQQVRDSESGSVRRQAVRSTRKVRVQRAAEYSGGGEGGATQRQKVRVSGARRQACGDSR